MLINGKRALAYTAYCGEIEEIPGADNIELMSVLGWKVIVKKGEFKTGEICVYFEIDSKLPEAEWSEFMRKKDFKVKTMKLSKFNVISQGLALPANLFDVKIPNEPDVDMTDLLGVTYAVFEDNVRKSTFISRDKYKAMASRKPNIFKKSWAKWMMRRNWGRQIMFAFFGRKKDKPRGFPSFVSKTDEERIENQPWRLGSNVQYIVTEKLDGTSCTYAMERKSFKRFEFYVCSRNVRMRDENQKCYHDHNIYWDLAFKYDIENKLKNYLLSHPSVSWVCIQGEGVGTVQGNPLELKENDLYVFNLIDSELGRYNSYLGRDIIRDWNMKWVPILGEFSLPDSMEEMKNTAHGRSMVNPEVLREGLVYRSFDGKDSFKNVDREYLLKMHQ